MRKSGKFGVILKVIYPAFKYKKNWNHVLKAHTEDIVTSKAKLETRYSDGTKGVDFWLCKLDFDL